MWVKESILENQVPPRKCNGESIFLKVATSHQSLEQE